MTISFAVSGYMFNINMLRRVFAPTFQLHDIKQTSQYEVTTRWTMNMQLSINKYNPFRKWWDPQLLFTGTSIMTINPSTGEAETQKLIAAFASYVCLTCWFSHDLGCIFSEFL